MCPVGGACILLDQVVHEYELPASTASCFFRAANLIAFKLKDDMKGILRPNRNPTLCIVNHPQVSECSPQCSGIAKHIDRTPQNRRRLTLDHIFRFVSFRVGLEFSRSEITCIAGSRPHLEYNCAPLTLHKCPRMSPVYPRAILGMLLWCIGLFPQYRHLMRATLSTLSPELLLYEIAWRLYRIITK